VTYIGAFGANWSNANNWFNGAIPDLSNVAHVIIPAGKKVNFDQSTVELNGAMTSAIEINGQLGLQGVDISNTLSGYGAVVVSGTQPTVIRGSNTYSGGTIIDANATLIAANDNALGLSPYISSSNGFFAMTDNIVLPSLDVSGPITLMSNINTIGSQYYGVVRDATTGNIIRDTLINISNVSTNSDVTLTYLPGVANDYEFNVNNVGHFHSLTGDIKFTGTLNGDTSYRNFALTDVSLPVVTISSDAIDGNVTFNNDVGQPLYNPDGTQVSIESYLAQNTNNINRLVVTASHININADIVTLNSQEYTGAIIVGDNGKNFNYDLVTGISNRTLLSEDPSITINGSINDKVIGTHILNIKAVSLDSQVKPFIGIYGSVGDITPLYGLNVTLGTQDQATSAVLSNISSDRDLTSYNGVLDLPSNDTGGTFSINTIGDQNYKYGQLGLLSPHEVRVPLFSEKGNINLYSSTGAADKAKAISEGYIHEFIPVFISTYDAGTLLKEIENSELDDKVTSRKNAYVIVGSECVDQETGKVKESKECLAQ
jgi:hypothetical protein